MANNFAAGVMEKFGLGPEDCARIKPDIIYLAMSMQGAHGPQRDFRGTGSSIAALTGIQELSGLPGRVPAGTGTNYPDHLPNPCHAAFALLAALRHRRRTGQGQYIDFAQTEPMLSLLGPTVPRPHGERPARAAPRQRSPLGRAAWRVSVCRRRSLDRHHRDGRRAVVRTGRRDGAPCVGRRGTLAHHAATLSRARRARSPNCELDPRPGMRSG